MDGNRGLEVADGSLVPACEGRHPASLLGEPRPLDLVRAEIGGLQVGGLGRLGGADDLGPLGGPGVGLASRGSKLVGVGVLAGGSVGVIEVGADNLGDLGTLVGEGRSKVLCGLEVPCLALGPGQHVVGDGSDERLREGVLAALGRELVRPDGQDLLAHERAQQLVETARVAVGDRLDRLAGEAPAQHRALLNEASLVGAEGVESRRDERRQPRRDLELA